MSRSWLQKRSVMICVVLLAAAFATGQADVSTKAPNRAPGSSVKRKSKKPRKSASWRRRGQQKIDANRAQQIQEALIREHYLNGKASGVWDSPTQKAMEKYQADNGWQSKTTPDSRALIKLGLGPDHDHLLNPESAMTGQLQTSPPSAPAATSPGDPSPSGPQR